jgi:hypothetical protein
MKECYKIFLHYEDCGNWTEIPLLHSFDKREFPHFIHHIKNELFHFHERKLPPFNARNQKIFQE